MKKLLILAAATTLVLAGCGGGDSPTSPDSGNSDQDWVEILTMTPAHETAGLEDLVELKIEFDRPVTDVAAVLVPEGLGYQTGDDWLLASEDGKTWTKTISARSGTAYQFVVLDVLAEDGNSMEEPVSAVFTTRQTFPTGSISGRVQMPPTESPVGSIIVVYDANQWVPSQGSDNNWDALRAFGIVEDAQGNYTVPHLHSGNYYVVAYQFSIEADSDGVVQSRNSYFGVFGEWAIFPEFEKISLAEGGSFTGADIPMLFRPR